MDEFERLEKKAKGEGLQSFMRQLISSAVSEVPEPESLHTVPASRRSYMEKLAKILASSDAEVIAAVTQNIDVFFDRLKTVNTEDKPPKPGSHRKAG